MGRRRINMKRIREIIRLKECGLSIRKISGVLKVSRPTVTEYIERCQACGLTYAQIENISDDELLTSLDASLETKAKETDRYRILNEKFAYMAKELKRVGVTLYLLWEEYRTEFPLGYGYSHFCFHYKKWSSLSEVHMHMEHKAGDKNFVDFTGHKMKIIHPITGEISYAEVFVATLGASQLTYAEATPSQKKGDWIKANENAFRYFGGVTMATVPDNLKSGVTKCDRYEPDINPEYADFAGHYGTVIIPARPKHPKDKALVENAVRLVYQRIFAPLRNQVFHSIEDLNRAIREKLEVHNNKPMQKLKVSRRQLFEEIEKDVLLPLPARRYEFKTFQKPTTVQNNYHVYLREDKHYYSVPYTHKGRKTGIIFTESWVEVHYKNIRIARHKRDRKPHGYTTLPEHMPSHHRYQRERSPGYFMRKAETMGVNVRAMIEKILKSQKHPEQSFNSCQGIIHLSDKYGHLRLERACKRALDFGNISYRSIRSILETGLDKIDEEQPTLALLPCHENIRGESYYKNGGIDEQRINA